MITYTLIGLLWCFILDMSRVTDEQKAMMTFTSRAFHTLLWPISLSMFIVAFLKEYFNGN